MSRNRIVLLTALVLTYPASAYGFNATGHKIIAEIAWQQLGPAQRQTIVDTLRDLAYKTREQADS